MPDGEVDSNILQKKMTRRRALGTSAAIGGVVAGIVVGGAAGYLAGSSSVSPGATKTATVTQTATQTVTASAASHAVNLNFTVWQYNVAEIKDNITKFQALNPNITVNLLDVPWPDYPGTQVKRFTSNTPIDVSYDGEDWLSQWASAGWVVPLEDIWDQYATVYPFKAYVNDMVPFAKQSMTFNGKVYGLPYYSDMFTFNYNTQILADNGLTVPTTWDEVRDVALKLKQKGVMEFPFILEMQAGGGGSFDFYIQLTAAYGNGARLFDENFNPLFNDPASPFYQYLQWLVDGLHKDQFISPDYLQNHETVVVQKLGAGQGAMTVFAKYNLAAANTPGSSPKAGQFRMALMPGKTHEAYGFAKMYNVTKAAVTRGNDAVQGAITFIEYFGGSKGPVLKRWATQDGLGFGFLSPYGDPDVSTALNTLYGPGAADIIKQQAALALTEPHPTWFGDWVQYCYTTAIPNALSQQSSVADAVKGMADKLKEVKSG